MTQTSKIMLDSSLLELINQHIKYTKIGKPTQASLMSLANACLSFFHDRMDFDENRKILEKLMKKAENNKDKAKIKSFRDKKGKLDLSKIQIKWVITDEYYAEVENFENTEDALIKGGMAIN